MTDTTQLDALIEAVEAGAFRRIARKTPRYSELFDALAKAEITCLAPIVMDYFHKGDAECAAFLKAYRAQVADNA